MSNKVQKIEDLPLFLNSARRFAINPYDEEFLMGYQKVSDYYFTVKPYTKRKQELFIAYYAPKTDFGHSLHKKELVSSLKEIITTVENSDSYFDLYKSLSWADLGNTLGRISKLKDDINYSFYNENQEVSFYRTDFLQFIKNNPVIEINEIAYKVVDESKVYSSEYKLILELI